MTIRVYDAFSYISTEANTGVFKGYNGGTNSANAANEGPDSAKPEAFRCGTTNALTNNRVTLRRRTDYGNAIRKHMARPKSAPEFFGEYMLGWVKIRDKVITERR